MENLENSYNKIKFNALNLETIFKFCPDGIVCKDNELNYIDANESYIKTFSANFRKITIPCIIIQVLPHHKFPHHYQVLQALS